MEIKLVTSDKKEFLELLLLADEQESMIDRYLERGDMFVLYDNGLKALCVVTREGEGIYEIKNIATVPFFQRQGYGKRLIEFLFEYYQGKCSEMLVGTGDVPSSRSFYEHCGFAISHRIKNFFLVQILWEEIFFPDCYMAEGHLCSWGSPQQLFPLFWECSLALSLDISGER